jgi:TPR repeat protein
MVSQGSAEKGDAIAQYNLGYMYCNGVSQDFAKAVEWYRKAAEQGSVYAQNKLGNMYLMVMAYPKNLPKQ